jgi:hypothetical protein
MKVMIDPATPASVRVRAAEAIFNHSHKAIEIEDIEVGGPNWSERRGHRNRANEDDASTMKLITKRICRLGTRVANHEVGGASAADILRERRRQRFIGSGHNSNRIHQIWASASPHR